MIQAHKSPDPIPCDECGAKTQNYVSINRFVETKIEENSYMVSLNVCRVCIERALKLLDAVL